jgi:hypothetical protein
MPGRRGWAVRRSCVATGRQRAVRSCGSSFLVSARRVAEQGLESVQALLPMTLVELKPGGGGGKRRRVEATEVTAALDSPSDQPRRFQDADR